MKIAHPFVVQILNKQDTHPLQAASDLSGEKMVELRGVVGNDYNPIKRSAVVVSNDLILPAKDTYHYLNLPEALQIRKGARAEVVRNTRNHLWIKVAWREKREDAQFARKFELALPPEMPLDSAREALTSFAESALVSKGMIVDLAIHEAHIIDVLAPDEPVTLSRTGFLMCTTRPFEGGVFVNKTRQWNDRNQMLEWRKEWFLELAKHMPDRATANLSQEAKDLWRFIERFTGAKEQPQSPPTHTTAPDLEMAEIVEPPKRMRL
jgi:hypothetical protein